MMKRNDEILGKGKAKAEAKAKCWKLLKYGFLSMQI
jgi:hypothetical protein